ncbi:MAG: RlmE family RNA methyltransferase [Deltaproteobacteria bacterium]|nr:RlmE family RNA methyltransferase [Deltaproteobacteria bacterium]
MAKNASRDYYFKKAKADNYPARSVYKLQEIDRRFKLLKPGFKVLDLGASPGSWSQYSAQRVGPRGKVLAVDLKPPAKKISGVTWLLGDVTQLSADGTLSQEKPFDVVLSDLAPKTTGHKTVDAARSQLLAEAAFNLAAEVLKPKGRALVKVFMGQDFPDLVNQIRGQFKRSRSVKPRASLKQSRETYLLAWEPKS